MSGKSKGKAPESRPRFSIFHFPADVVPNLQLPSRLNRLGRPSTPQAAAAPERAQFSTPHADSQDAEISRAFASARLAQPTCHTCGGIEFADTQEQREHFKTQVHQRNMQRKLEWRQSSQGKDKEKDANEYPWRPVRGDDEGEDGENASKAASSAQHADGDDDDEDSDDEEQTPYLWFTEGGEEGQVAAYGVHRRMLVAKGTHGVHVDATQVLEELTQMQLAAAPAKTLAELKAEKRGTAAAAAAGAEIKIDDQSTLWAVLAQNGGHFAGAVFDNRTGAVVTHKTIQRYTTRRKQGGLQSRQDGASGRAAISAGAQIRRYNERKLQEEIHEIVERWRPLLLRCTRVFVRVAREGRRTFFGPENARPSVSWNDPRVQPVPVAMGRPSLAELRRVYRDMTRVRMAQFDLGSAATDAAEALQAAVDVGDSEDEDSGSLSEHTLEPEPRPDLIAFVFDVAQKMLDTEQTDAEIVAHMCTHAETLLDAFSDPAVGLRYLDGCAGVQAHRTPTLLHLAALVGRRELIGFLLDYGEDPTVTNGHAPLYAGGMTAYQVAQDRPTRDAFRVYRFEHQDDEDGIEWDRARVPDALSPEQQRENEARVRDKKKRERERRKQRERAQKEKRGKQQQQQQQKDEDERDSGEEMMDKIIAEKEAQEAKQTLRNRVKNMTPKEIQERMRNMAAGAWDAPKAKPTLSLAEQRAADRELRFQAAQRRQQNQQQSTDSCTHCGKSLHGVVPFEQFDWKCCSVECLHGQQQLYGTNI
ncbi:hypothetical protein IWW50_000460 [Coemansia erecta]|nr:hypothetical protein IWW50_000460 [Coemansia erecta]